MKARSSFLKETFCDHQVLKSSHVGDVGMLEFVDLLISTRDCWDPHKGSRDKSKWMYHIFSFVLIYCITGYFNLQIRQRNCRGKLISSLIDSQRENSGVAAARGQKYVDTLLTN